MKTLSRFSSYARRIGYFDLLMCIVIWLLFVLPVIFHPIPTGEDWLLWLSGINYVLIVSLLLAPTLLGLRWSIYVALMVGLVLLVGGFTDMVSDTQAKPISSFWLSLPWFALFVSKLWRIRSSISKRNFALLVLGVTACIAVLALHFTLMYGRMMNESTSYLQ